jgi:hypothetical protein
MTLKIRLPPNKLTPIVQERFQFFSFSLSVLFRLSLVFILLLMNAVLSECQSREKLAMAKAKLR